MKWNQKLCTCWCLCGWEDKLIQRSSLAMLWSSFREGLKFVFPCLRHLFAWEAENTLPQESTMEILDVCILFCLTHTPNWAHPHIADISFWRVFKLPHILVQLYKGCFLFFFVISCAFRVRSCPCFPHSPPPPPFAFPLSFTPPLCSAAPCCQREQTSGYTQCLTGALLRSSALTDQHRTAQHTAVPRLPPLPSPPTTHLLQIMTHFS